MPPWQVQNQDNPVFVQLNRRPILRTPTPPPQPASHKPLLLALGQTDLHFRASGLWKDQVALFMAQENTGILLLSKRLHPLQLPLDLNSSQSARLHLSFPEYSSDSLFKPF